MSYSLGIDIGAEITAAVIVDRQGRLTTLELGDGRIATASMVFVGDDGSTTVGDAAGRVEGDGELASDPMGQLARSGDGYALRGLVAHVLGRATAAMGEAPGLVGLVCPDDWNMATRDELTEVGRAAGANSVVLVSDRVAVRHRVEGPEPATALAAGAALVAAASVGPIVTREDMGQEPSGRPPAAPTDPPVVSVFDGAGAGSDDEVPAVPAAPTSPDPPVSPAGGPGAEPAPVVEPTTALPAYRPPPPPRATEPGNRRPILVAAGVTVIAVAAIVVLFVLAGGTSGDSTDAVASSTLTTSTLSTTTAAVTTTSAPATTAPSSTTSTSSTTSSTSTTSTSTSSTSTTSTTTVPVAVGSPGLVTLVETGLVLDTGSVLRLGDDGDQVLAEIMAALDKPDSDSGFSEVAFCFAPRTRFVRWSQLEVVISEQPDGSTTFTQWYVDGADDPPGLVTIDGLGVGATVGFLNVNYGGSLNLVPAFEGAESGIFAVTNSGSGGTLLGITESLEPEARVLQMWAGDECTRVFT